MRAHGFWLGAIILALAACGKGADELLVQPQIQPDRTALTFGQPANGTYVGTSPINSLQLRNEGQDDLVIQSVSLSGSSAFDIADGPSPKTVPSGQASFIQVSFTPSSAKQYTGTLTIVSNAQNTPKLEISLSGLGCIQGQPCVAPDAGT